MKKKEKAQKSIIPKTGLTKKSVVSQNSPPSGKEGCPKGGVVGEIIFVPIYL